MQSLTRPTFAAALQRLDLLIHREILRLRANYQLSLDEFRGLYISDQQVDELIRQRTANSQLDVTELEGRADQLLRPARENLARDERWQRLCQGYRLSDFEQEVMLLAFVPEIHSKYPVLFAYLNNDITRKYPTLELGLNLFSKGGNHADRQAFSAQGTLVQKGLILSLEQTASNYTLQSGFVLSPPVREYLLGHAAVDPQLVDVCHLMPMRFAPWADCPFSEETVQQFEAFSRILQESSDPPYFIIEGDSGSGASSLAENSLFAAGLACCRIDLKLLLSDRENTAGRARSICHTAMLERAGLLIADLSQVLDATSPDKNMASLFLRELVAGKAPAFLLVPPKTPWRDILPDHQFVVGSLGRVEPGERQRFWHYHLQQVGMTAAQDDLAAVADYFKLSYVQVRNAARDLAIRQGLENRDRHLTRKGIFAAARTQSYSDMGGLAAKVEKGYCLDDLVLPQSTLNRIRDVISATKSRRLVYEKWGLQRRMGGGTGLVALFSGPSGTGKTMTASIIAREIGLDLYCIELSNMVSKYIGDTEKNFDRIFAAANQANCILFFDEADALFGKRSEVKDAHDRYANIEVAYLLQKIENYDGIVILTTNLAKNIDQAFTRRMQFIIEFARPDVEHRKKLWRGMLGDAVPLADDVDFNFLARHLDCTGGDIRNMALDAALMAAAAENKIINMAFLMRAAARQMMKQGRVPSAVDFKQYFSLVADNIGKGA